MSSEHAQTNLKRLLIEPATGAKGTYVRPIFVVRIKKVKGSTSSHVRFFIAEGGEGVTAMSDITGRVASALGCFNKYNNNTGNYLNKGEDLTSTINALSVMLFADWRAIPAYVL